MRSKEDINEIALDMAIEIIAHNWEEYAEAMDLTEEETEAVKNVALAILPAEEYFKLVETPNENNNSGE